MYDREHQMRRASHTTMQRGGVRHSDSLASEWHQSPCLQREPCRVREVRQSLRRRFIGE